MRYDEVRDIYSITCVNGVIIEVKYTNLIGGFVWNVIAIYKSSISNSLERERVGYSKELEEALMIANDYADEISALVSFMR